MGRLAKQMPLQSEVEYTFSRATKYKRYPNWVFIVIIMMLIVGISSTFILINHQYLSNVFFPYRGQILYVANTSQLAAFRSDNGAELWAVPIQGQPNEQSFYLANGTIVIEMNGGLQGLDLHTGGMHWDLKPSAHGKITLAMGQAQQTPLIYATQIAPTRKAGALLAIDANSGAVRWQYPFTDGIPTSVVSLGKSIAVGSGSGDPATTASLTLLDADSGVVRWKTAIAGASLTIPHAYDDKAIYIGVNLDTFCSINILTGKLLWFLPLAKFTDSFPSVNNGRVFISTPAIPISPSPYANAEVRAYDASTIQLQWQTSLPTLVSNSVFPINKQSIVVEIKNEAQEVLVAIDSSTGDVVWQSDNLMQGNKIYMSSDQSVLYATNSDSITAFMALSGAVKWTLSLPHDNTNAGTILTSQGLFQIRKGHVLNINASTGTMKWQTSFRFDVSDGVWLILQNG